MTSAKKVPKIEEKANEDEILKHKEFLKKSRVTENEFNDSQLLLVLDIFLNAKYEGLYKLLQSGLVDNGLCTDKLASKMESVFPRMVMIDAACSFEGLLYDLSLQALEHISAVWNVKKAIIGDSEAGKKLLHRLVKKMRIVKGSPKDDDQSLVKNMLKVDGVVESSGITALLKECQEELTSEYAKRINAAYAHPCLGMSDEQKSLPLTFCSIISEFGITFSSKDEPLAPSSRWNELLNCMVMEIFEGEYYKLNAEQVTVLWSYIYGIRCVFSHGSIKRTLSPAGAMGAAMACAPDGMLPVSADGKLESLETLHDSLRDKERYCPISASFLGFTLSLLTKIAQYFDIFCTEAILKA